MFSGSCGAIEEQTDCWISIPDGSGGYYDRCVASIRSGGCSKGAGSGLVRYGIASGSMSEKL